MLVDEQGVGIELGGSGVRATQLDVMVDRGDGRGPDGCGPLFLSLAPHPAGANERPRIGAYVAFGLAEKLR